MVKKIQINLSNKVYYTLVVIGLIVLFGIVVYATAPNPGHTWEEIECIDCIDAGDIADDIGACSLICTDARGLTTCSQCDNRFLTIPQDFVAITTYGGNGAFILKKDYPTQTYGGTGPYGLFCQFRMSSTTPQLRAYVVGSEGGCDSGWQSSTETSCAYMATGVKCRLGYNSVGLNKRLSYTWADTWEWYAIEPTGTI